MTRRNRNSGAGRSVAAPIELKFHIDAYTPETIPLERLAEYLYHLSIVLGERQSVHFDRLESGSTQPVVRVDFEALPKVRKRASAVRNNEGPEEARRAKARLDQMLADDNASGELVTDRGSRLLYFPGKKRHAEQEYGPVTQPGTLDGVPIVIGGENDPVPVHLEDGPIVHNCLASRLVAKDLTRFLFSTPIRATGVGRWWRDGTGVWQMKQFRIEGFAELRAGDLGEVAKRLHRIDAKWKTQSDPVNQLVQLRTGSE